MTSRRVAGIAVCLVLAGCAAEQAEFARRGRSELIGMREDDVRMCAGHPSNEDKISGGKIWMYEHGGVSPGGVTVTPVLPVAGASFGGPNGGYCRVQLRIVNGRVTDVSYAGATDLFGGEDAECGPIVRNCLYGRGRTAARSAGEGGPRAQAGD